MTAAVRRCAQPGCRRPIVTADPAYCGEHDTAIGEPRCPVTDLIAAQCAHCRPGSDRPQERRPGYGGPFRARYSGQCADCGEQFAEGDEIAPLTDGTGYVCQECLA